MTSGSEGPSDLVVELERLLLDQFGTAVSVQDDLAAWRPRALAGRRRPSGAPSSTTASWTTRG